MQKEELLRLLQDPDVCREIFLIMKNGGKPNVHAAAPKAAPSSDEEKLASIKNKLKKINAIEDKPAPAAVAPTPPPAAKPNLTAAPGGASFGDKLALLRNQVNKTNEERAAQAKAAEEKKASAK